MRTKVARSLSLVLMIAALPVISFGTTRDRPAVWWLGLASLAVGASIPPALRFLPPRPEEEPEQQPTDLGDSSRVC